MTKRAFLTILCLGFTLFSVSANPTIDSLWAVGNEHYQAEDYRRAALDYQQVVDLAGGDNWQLFYNLGNSYFRSNDLGRAILNFKRALRLDPTNPDILHNLSVARARTTDKIEALPGFFLVDWTKAIRDSLSINMWTILCFIFVGITLLCLLIWQGKKLSRFGVFMVISGVLAIVFYLFGNSAYMALHNENEAVVTNTSTVVRSAPNNNSPELFILREGTELEILEQNDNYTSVAIASGDQGWLLSTDVEKI